MSRWQAALIHLSISALVAGIACTLLLGIWYPPPYFHANGGQTLLILLVGVDVTLGPLLTFVVFKSGKPSLKFDLAVIATLQAAALVYGFHVMLASRPVFMVAAMDRFVLVAANQLDPADVAEASRPEWRHLSWSGPVLVGTARPRTTEERNDLMFSGLAGKDIEKFPKYYVPYADAAEDLLKRAHPLDELRRMHPAHTGEIDAWLRRHDVHDKELVWVPVVARDSDLCMLMDKANGEPIGAIELDPWQAAPGS